MALSSSVFKFLFVVTLLAESGLSEQCTPEDEAGWMRNDWGKTFSIWLEQYGVQCAFLPDMVGCVAEKARRDFKLSYDCSRCFGESASCGKGNCMFKGCMGGRCNGGCLSCIDEHCKDPLQTCAGTSRNLPWSGC